MKKLERTNIPFYGLMSLLEQLKLHQNRLKNHSKICPNVTKISVSENHDTTHNIIKSHTKYYNNHINHVSV